LKAPDDPTHTVIALFPFPCAFAGAALPAPGEAAPAPLARTNVVAYAQMFSCGRMSSPKSNHPYADSEGDRRHFTARSLPSYTWAGAIG
jgi:hypothetical protein